MIAHGAFRDTDAEVSIGADHIEHGANIDQTLIAGNDGERVGLIVLYGKPGFASRNLHQSGVVSIENNLGIAIEEDFAPVRE
ncbi:hypothetical protein SPHV1_100003 [Novosphingobium sp. KN65.2]|nr:hypothetical protein SPHV1_100003 [Novosphingobium sp. KN65.2]